MINPRVGSPLYVAEVTNSTKEDELRQLLKLSLFGHLISFMIVFWLVVFGFKLMPFVQYPCTLEYPEHPVPMPVPTPANVNH